MNMNGRDEHRDGAMHASFEGLEVGAISVKWVQRDLGGRTRVTVRVHNGKPREIIEELWGQKKAELKDGNYRRVIITGQAAKQLINAHYRSTTECLEKALVYQGKSPDMLLVLGGETFSLYPMKDGVIKNVIATSKCAAGTGEFIVQQFQRMGMSLEQGLQAFTEGKRVELATRCSVHCKSDATHKLNKGECSRSDIARSLVEELAQRVADMVTSEHWPARSIAVSGGVTTNQPFMQALKACLPESCVESIAFATALEAFGAALLAEEMTVQSPKSCSDAPAIRQTPVDLERLAPLQHANHLLDYRVPIRSRTAVVTSGQYIVAIDAGSTTTKAALLRLEDGAVSASCYLRTLGNPITATRECLKQLIEQAGRAQIEIVQTAATGSGREMVSVFLNNGLSFNEILAHARAAADQVREVGTVFEIGGQDSKYISFINGVPVGYAMNEGCSAGTGSFLEESAWVDMGVKTEAISALAESSETPIAFGERCAAFINTDIRNALQQGARPNDVIAGLVYSIADNYISRIVGPRPIRDDLLFLGGVALNRAVALAIAARTGRRVVVPEHPELMGCMGAALMARDWLADGRAQRVKLTLDALGQEEMSVKGKFRCRSCENLCEVQTIAVGSRSYPFGGLCSKYELQRRKEKQLTEGRDLVKERNRMMFEQFKPEPVSEPRGTIGLPLALSTYELFPFYAALINELGSELVVSESFREGMKKTMGAICYPCQVAHGAVYDLSQKAVDFIFVPRLIELTVPRGNLHSYTCPSTAMIPDVVRSAFPDISYKLLAPHLAMSASLRETSIKEIERLATALKVSETDARRAAERAFAFFKRFREAYRSWGSEVLGALRGEPAVVLAGRPYSICDSAINLALPRKITSRGYHAIPADMLPPVDGTSLERDVWGFTQQITNALEHVQRNPTLHVCLVSCFSCGPDSVMYHLFRERLAGRPFCYLEIDSHTAHAGFETRVGAFLDIVEEESRRRAYKKPPATRADTRNKPGARLARLSEQRDCFVDSCGAQVDFKDPRVVHVFTDVVNPVTARLLQTVYKKYGLRSRVAPQPTARTMQFARTVCSGRECVPLVAMVGAMVDDLSRNRTDEELTVYLTLDQQGPCQNGAWPLVWHNFLTRLDATNAIGGINRSSDNKQLGFNGAQIQEVNKCVLLGDLLREARHALSCLALDHDRALRLFDKSLIELCESIGNDGGNIETVLDRWAKQMAHIPLIVEVQRATKVLIIGGLNLIFVHHPVSEYFLNQGILIKVVDVAEGAQWIESEGCVRMALKYGFTEPVEQMAVRPDKSRRDDAIKVRTSRYGITVINEYLKRLRALMEPSGLMFDEHIEFPKILEAGHAHVSNNAFSETSVTVGRFVCSEKSDTYDGIINLGSFNCQPAMNSQAVIRPLASHSPMPYIALDCEGPWISANQTRLLEALAVQARRKREDKNARSSG